MRNQSGLSNIAAIKRRSRRRLDGYLRSADPPTWLPEPVPVGLRAYELARLGPTSANGSPARFVF
jgi:hypothetical protein